MLDVHQFELRMFAQLLVQRRQGFIQKQKLRLPRQCARQGDPLALAAGNLVRLAVAELGQLHEVQHFPNAVLALCLGHLLVLEAVGDVLFHRHVGEQRIALEHHVNRTFIGRNPGHVLPVDEDAPLGRGLEACEHPQERGLAAAGAAKKGEDLALPDIKRDGRNRRECSEALRYTLDPDERARLPGCSLGRS